MCDDFESPWQKVLGQLHVYRVLSQRSALALVLLNSVATAAAQPDEIVPFFAALAAIPAACFTALMPLRISFLAFFLPLVPAA